MENINNGSSMRVAGRILFGIGFILVLAGFTMSTTAEYSDTLNMGLLNDQTNRIISGGFFAVGGSVLYAAGEIIAALQKLLQKTETEDKQ